MNWQLISFFGDSTVLLPSAAALFIVLMLRKTSRLLAWQWSLLFGITGAIVCASKLAFMGWGLGIRELDYTGFSGHSALSAAFWPIFLWLLSARFSAGVQKQPSPPAIFWPLWWVIHGWSSMRIPSRK
jgi:hypothetical protein